MITITENLNSFSLHMNGLELSTNVQAQEILIMKAHIVQVIIRRNDTIMYMDLTNGSRLHFHYLYF